MFSRVTQGGNTVVVGGWGEYEITRRTYNKDEYEKVYIGRSYITTADMAESILLSCTRNLQIMRDATNDLIEIINSATYNSFVFGESDFCLLPPINIHSIKSFSSDKYKQIDPYYLRGLVGDCKELPNPVILPSASVKITDVDEISNLEQKVGDYISYVEDLQGAYISSINDIIKWISSHPQSSIIP